MFECLVFGDSISQGLGQAVNAAYVRQCDVIARRSAGTGAMLTWRRPLKFYGTAVISAGSNDVAGQQLGTDLVALRRSLASRRVIWLLPYSRPQAYIVASVAAVFGDETLDLVAFASIDRIHPSRYGDVARAMLRPASVSVKIVSGTNLAPAAE